MKALCSKLKDDPENVVYLTARHEERGKAAVNQLNKVMVVNPCFCVESASFVISVDRK